jgi:acetyl-CoA carboxylase biotin carboxylase subunit
MKIKKILIANRGEIALRIIRSCRQMGIRSVAVYSDADKDLPFVRQADEALPLGAPALTDSYLNGAKIIAAAASTHCDAVHPGYGFLSENADFSGAVIKAGLIFIGPTPAAMRMIGHKTSARKLANSLGVPTLEGTIEPVRNAAECSRIADKIGFPIILKAAGGGGGKGMRPVYQGSEIESALSRSRSEAATAFGDDRIFVERFLENPRHIEVQLLADSHGNAIHLGERECSIQRRHQKIIEESPSTIVNDELRARLTESALTIVKAAKYTNAGTVEFILDEENHFFFLEVNTRLQVEHPVTEMRTGLDLIQEQIRIAAGEHLDRNQNDVTFSGHAVECRIYAEDSQNSFFPSTGEIVHFQVPGGFGIRNDIGFEEGNIVTPYYDSLLGKLIAWGADRSDALGKMASALNEYEIFGVRNNLDLLSWIVGHPLFVKGKFDTNFLQKHFKPEFLFKGRERLDKMVALTAVEAKESADRRKFIPDLSNISKYSAGWQSRNSTGAEE